MFFVPRVTIYKWNWEPLLDLLESEIWLDKQTRAVFIEFVVNNMNVNVFTQVKLILELPISGGTNYKLSHCMGLVSQFHRFK